MQPVDLVALSSLTLSRFRLSSAAAHATAADGRLDSALRWLGPDGDLDAGQLRRDAEASIAAAHRLGMALLPWDAAGYPTSLGQIPDPPLALWVRGRLPLSDWPSVAIVGSRAASPAACEIARGIAAGLARRGVPIVSGLARGCDGEAHQGALDGGGPTIAVLGSGPDVIYPCEHRSLADDILESGAIISEFRPGTPPLPHHFPLRNRIISGLSRGVVVVEAGEKSGSLITAACALDQGREVMVVPGPVLSGRNRGAHALLRDGAALVESAEDVLHCLARWLPASSHLGTRGRAQEAPHGDPGDPVLAALDQDDGRDVDDLVAATGLAAAAILVRLTELELTGEARRHPGGRFVRSRGK